MEVEVFTDPASFRRSADPLLLENEAVNNLILGISGSAILAPASYHPFFGWVVDDDGHPVGAAIRTPPRILILGPSRSDDALHLLADQIDDLPGVVGEVPSVETFVGLRPETAVLKMRQGIFQLDEVVPPPAVGNPRPATPDEHAAIVEMRFAFEEEAVGGVEDDEMVRRGTLARLEEQSATFGMWVLEVDGELVSISGHGGPTPNGIRIGPVYTPPEHRGRGYASALVAAQSQWLLDSGHRFCFLYTDLANPTSNSVYRRIGYRQVGESAEYSFSAA